jgi:hypothetical protein
VSQDAGTEAAVDAGVDVSVDTEIEAGLDAASEPEVVTCPGDVPPLPGSVGSRNRVNQAGVAVMPSSCGVMPAAEMPPNTFDDSTASKWLCFLQGPTFDLPNIEYRFSSGTAYAVNAYTVTSANDNAPRDPKDWRLEGSNDDGATWSLVDVRTNEAFAGRLQPNSYVITNCVAYARYRFVVTAIAGDPSVEQRFQVAEIQLFGPTHPTNLTIAGTVTTSQTCGGNNPAETPAHAFDDDISSKWFCGGATTPMVDIALAAPHAVNAYSVTSGNDAPDRDPKDWILQGSNDPDAGTWVDLNTQTGQTFVVRTQTLTYTFTNTTAYANYRFKVTANNGSADFQVAEIKLFGN